MGERAGPHLQVTALLHEIQEQRAAAPGATAVSAIGERAVPCSQLLTLIPAKISTMPGNVAANVFASS